MSRPRPISQDERIKRLPRPPAELLDALQDSVHKELPGRREARSTRLRSLGYQDPPKRDGLDDVVTEMARK